MTFNTQKYTQQSKAELPLVSKTHTHKPLTHIGHCVKDGSGFLFAAMSVGFPRAIKTGLKVYGFLFLSIYFTPCQISSSGLQDLGLDRAMSQEIRQN